MGDDFEIFQAIWEEITAEVVSDEWVVLVIEDNEVALEHQGRMHADAWPLCVPVPGCSVELNKNLRLLPL